MADTQHIDPLGRVIILHDHTWHKHILRRHPELHMHRAEIGNAIEHPAEIRISDYDPDCRTCYGQGPKPAIMFAVVIDIQLGLVRTAFLTHRMKGAVEWSQPIP